MKIRIAILKVLLFFIVAAKAKEPPRPNIIFILCDDLGYGDVGAFYQNQRATLHDRSVPFFATPQIDTLARDGARLTQHYCGAPVCAPSRGSLLTGLTQGHCNVRDNQFDKALADTWTIGSVLQQGGYATAAFGKWGLQGKPGEGINAANDEENSDSPGGNPETWPAYPTKRGFDFYFGYVRHQDGHFHYPKEDHREVWENDQEVSSNLDLCYTTDLFTARAKKWIVEHEAAKPGEPFFVYLAFDTPHAKLQNPPCAYPPGGGLHGGVQWTGQPHAMLNTATGTMDGYMFPDYAKATWDNDHDPATPEVPWPDVQKRYANDVRRIDFAVGDVLQLLKDLKIDTNTLVVFTSDNGPSIESYLPQEPYAPTFFRGFGPFDGIKRDTLEGGEREPTLARWPRGIPAGREIPQPSGQWDWLATFADLAGLPEPAASDGVSLLPSLTGQGQQRPGTLYVEYFESGKTPRFQDFAPAHRGRTRNQMQTIYLDGYKGIRYDVKSAEDDFEIYDVTRDPQEAHNLAGDPKFAALQTEMKARVLQVRNPDESAKRPYDDAYVTALANEPSAKPGVTRLAINGTWPWMPDFRTLSSGTKVVSQGFAPPVPKDNAPFGVAFEGFFKVPTDGDYTFTINSDGGAMLFVHEIRVIAEAKNPVGGTLTGHVRLAAGWHPLRLYYRHITGQPQLEFAVKNADGTRLELNTSDLRQAND